VGASAGQPGDTLARMERDGAMAWISLAAGVAGTCVATWMVLIGERSLAGWAAAIACVGLTSAAVTSHQDAARFLGAVAYRLFDGAVLSAIAWSARSTAPSVSVAAVLALIGGFLAAYFAAKGRALGYDVDASTVNRFVRTGLVAVALLSGNLSFWMWTLAILSLLTAVVRASQTFKEEMV